MVETIANTLAENYADLNFVSKAAGAIQLLHKPLSGKKETVIPVAKTIYTGDAILTCDIKTPYYEMFPNEKQSCVLYFEDGGAKAIATNRRFTTYKGKLRLVCWFNTKKIDPLIKTQVLKDQIYVNLLPEIPKTGQLLATKINVENIAPNRPHPFEQFRLNEALKQFTVYPYDYFVLNLRYICHYGNNCAVIAVLNPSEC